jgi:transcriptional regulator with XRE-family HTH domain
MTYHSADYAARAISENLRRLIQIKYGTQTAAARAWDVSQGAISLLINGKRGTGRSQTLARIAAAEGISIQELSTVAGGPTLKRVSTDEDRSPRFVYDVDDPHRMLKQVQSWFADLPAGARMTRQVVKVVMRTLLDESFDFEIHRPPRTWQPVMDSAEGWPPKVKSKARSDRRSGRGFGH